MIQTITIQELEALPRFRRAGGSEYSSGCPACGGEDRFRSWPTGEGRETGIPYAWCRQCGAQYKVVGKADASLPQAPRKPRRTEPEFDQSLADKWHAAITPRARAYFSGRGISVEAQNRAKLGFRQDWNRYSIPCYVGDKCMAIQYRAAGPCDKKKRYISERGGVNKVLFNTAVLRYKPAYVLIVEGPLDALALTSHGYPAVSAFSGNSYGGWEAGWNHWFAGIQDRIVIPDGDEAGQLIALGKLNDIPSSRSWPLPAGFKDSGEFIQKDLDTAAARLYEWLKIPPVL